MPSDEPRFDLKTIPMDAFHMKWRFTDSRYDLLPADHLAQILPVAAADARELNLRIRAAELTTRPFCSVERTAINESADELAEGSRIRDWLYRRGVPFQQRIWLSYGGDSAVETTWKMLVEYWNAFWYPSSDDLVVVDESFRWVLTFHHEGGVAFAMDEVPKLPEAQRETEPRDRMKDLGKIPTSHVGRVRFLPEADQSIVASIRLGLLFMMAFWSGPSRKGFSLLIQSLAKVDPQGRLELVVVDVDGSPDLYDLPEFGGGVSGAGEVVWVKEGKVVSTSMRGFHPESFKPNTQALLASGAPT